MSIPARRISSFLSALVILTVLSPAHAGETSQPEEDRLQSTHPRLDRLLPAVLLIGPQAGMTGSRLTATKDFRSVLEPTAAEREERFDASLGVLLSLRWRSGLTLTLAPRREAYGLDTREETVSFPDNPFPHTLRSSTGLSYNVWPLLLGYGWFPGRQHVQIQAGTYAAFLDRSRIVWTVDDDPYPRTPQPLVRSTQSGVILAAEYGYRLGPGEFLIAFGAQQEFHSLMGGFRGSVQAQSARASLAYAWVLMSR